MPALPQNGQWLTPLQFGKYVHLSRSSVYRRIDEGDIPKSMLDYAGPRKILIHRAAVQLFKLYWKVAPYRPSRFMAPIRSQNSFKAFHE